MGISSLDRYKAFFVAFLFSFFIYVEYFNLPKYLSFVSIFSYYYLYKFNKKNFIISGFFIGIFWFWWIALSFRYYNLSYLIPFVILGVGTIFAVIFYIIDLSNKKIIRILLFFSLSYIHPFGFDWFKPHLPLIYPFLNNKVITNKDVKIDNLNINVPSINLAQDKKWDKKNLPYIINNNFELIKKSIKNRYDIIVLPETAFPMVLNINNLILNKLKKLSNKITIVVGGLNYQKKHIFNSTYIFNKGDLIIANKVILVPFGEKIYLPKFLVDFINNTFFDGATDYQGATKKSYYKVKNKLFLNAICYEATSDEFYKNIKTKHIIALSNMAWFYPSTASSLQNILLNYYAFKYNLNIIHSVNLYKKYPLFNSSLNK